MVVHGYKAFTLVEGSRVAKDYGSAQIRTRDGLKPFRFRHHSAGPFGDDIHGRWEDPDSFFQTLAIAGLGWKDIHASTDVIPEPPPSNAAIARRQAARLGAKAFQALKLRTVGRMRG
jgi:hypothetical protein